MARNESLRAMRRNAMNAYVSARPGASYSITMDAVRLGDLTDAASLIEQMAAEIRRMHALAERLQSQKPVAWVRHVNDGSIQGPLLDQQMDDVRRTFWTPLIAAEWASRGDGQLKEAQ